MLDVHDLSATQDELRKTQLELLELNRLRLTPSIPSHGWRDALRRQSALMLVEGEFLEAMRETIADEAAAVSTKPQEFINWFAQLEKTGPGQHDSLFPWLAEQANAEQMKWFLTQEVAGEAGFEDLTAITQVRLPARPKLEMARNYWDEMGRGNLKGMHGPLLQRLADALRLRPDSADTVTEALTLANVMAGMALNRRYAYHSVGALGAIELTAPGRAALVNAGLDRLGFPAHIRHYFSLHAVLDIKHSQTWNAEVILPLVDHDPLIGRAIAEGALMRLRCGAACFERYRAQLW